MCPLGTACEHASGHTLAKLPLQHGYWRSSNLSADVRRCPDAGRSSSGCVGTQNSTHAFQCKEGLTGPYCRLCLAAKGHYYDELRSACKSCRKRGVSATSVLLAVLLAFGVIANVNVWQRMRLSPPMIRWLTYLWTSTAGLGIKTKLKIMWSLYQVSTQVPSIYQVRLPDSVQQLLRVFEIAIDLGIDGFVTQQLQCLGASGFFNQLLAYMLLPLLLLLITYLACLSRVHLRSRAVSSPRASAVESVSQRRQALLRAAPFMLLIAFLAFPVVSSCAFWN